jgi:hypothetical protein
VAHFEAVQEVLSGVVDSQQRQQDVFGADEVVIGQPRLLLRQDHRLPGPVGEAFEHAVIVAGPALRGTGNSGG